ncbi:MAG: hypothetical protein BROFUL_00646 [Candidatus Brocadia fulgida]|uniref:Uncharacterized protein n=1 Tax=Candidatus Brocadia fulgida TaxID=380242 RepID=A0A0M2UYG2_9BACT|nr:MAG: hypothetical protein BROFUL_00646 [Candidatus Brocadia fulgida]
MIGGFAPLNPPYQPKQITHHTVSKNPIHFFRLFNKSKVSKAIWFVVPPDIMKKSPLYQYA